MPDPMPRRPEAMKATLTREVFDDPNWIVERKLDGYRCLAFRDGGSVALESRNFLSLNGRYPEVAAALEEQPCRRFVIDGEVVAFAGRRSSFEALQRRAHDPGVRVFFYIFDVLWLDGEDLRAEPLRQRKAALRRALHFGDPLRWTPHRRAAQGEALLADACRRGWEGLIAKRGDSRYVGKRSGDWLKWKCSAEQELVIGGYTAPRGARHGFGALLVGHYDGDALRYAGKVGTGFDERELRSLLERMARLERPDSPFGAGDPPARGTTWVEPELVAQVAFTEWTRDGRLRHPRYLGLRDDKPARQVVRERPA
jgi:bifunctional non-homologous end joining protein LigD